MRSWHRESLAAFAVVLAVALRCFGQNSPGPATLENLVNADEAQDAPAVSEVDEGDAAPKRPAGTVVRPKNGVQHPDIDKAWAEYETAVNKAAESIKAAISKQFDAAAAKGDLDAAEKWQAIGERFEKAGEVPIDAEAKAAVSAAVADYKKAKDELGKAYESVVKALTMEKRIADAKAARDESLALRGLAERVPANKPLPVVRNAWFEVLDQTGRVRVVVHLLGDGSVFDDRRVWTMRRWRQQGDKLVMTTADKQFIYRYDKMTGEWIMAGERLRLLNK